MKLRCRKWLEAGSTLAEVSVAIAVLAITGGALIGAFNYGFFSMQMTRENQRATQIMLEKAETIRLYRWDQVNTPGFIPATFEDVYDPQAPVGSQGVTYYGTLSITNPPFAATSYSSNLRQLTITLTWTNSSGGIVRTRSLATLIAKDGMQNYVY
ncbi:MAG TPA: hypothetical protein GYA07_03005 [Verrucomicrobia bacterium]|nr:hypothetical protein [Verrucomicrobiota bacterium]HOP97843.1 hypothetical protein [Verrucomicrobiota bacterium]